MAGHVKLHRSINDNDLWLLEPFSKGQAWVDLFLNANWKPGVIDVRGNIVDIGRGQLGWSELTMAKRWQWSRGKVRRFLSFLERSGNIRLRKTHVTTIITICNYEMYQGAPSVDVSTAVGEAGSGSTNDRKWRNGVLFDESPCRDSGQDDPNLYYETGYPNNDSSAETTGGATGKQLKYIRRDTIKEGKEGKEDYRGGVNRFVPPSKRETADFFIDNGSSVEDAGSFFYHFEERDWALSNGKKMKDWRQSARKWIHNSKTKYRKQYGAATTAERKGMSVEDFGDLISDIQNIPGIRRTS